LPRLGQRRALIFGMAFAVMGHIAFGLATRGWMIYLIVFPFALGGIAGPATQAIITKEVGATEQGELQGSVNSVGGLAAIIGPLIGTALLGRFGPENAHPHIAGSAFFVAACFDLLGLALALRVFAKVR
jgi:DHA1 family tetracycline resistance protein-like MFS transporter